ncbi:MAG: signal peptidase I [Alphaproteobacteria bacterium]|nr:signal peptidase I [Alphaproteobacteria bacterium]
MSLSEVPSKTKKPARGWLHEIVSTIVYPLALVLGVYTLLFQPFRIPSGSMIDTLLIGDFVWVSKFSYGYSKHSIPFSPDVFDGRIWGAEPTRGDVVVFKLPRDNSTDYIKRLIGLPGDKVQVIRGVLHINGQPVKMEYVGEVDVTSEGSGNYTRHTNKYLETLPNGVSHYILQDDRPPREGFDAQNTDVYVVPAGHYFFMGDNRDNSTDSRWPIESGVGFVPYENLVGRADRIFPSWDSQKADWWEVWEWPFAVRWDRLLQPID